FVGLAEVFVPKPVTAVGGKRGWMSAGEHQMFFSIDLFSFFLCRATPQKKDKILLFFGKDSYHRIGEFFPAFTLVRACLSCSYCKRGIKHKHSLFRPMLQISV